MPNGFFIHHRHEYDNAYNLFVSTSVCSAGVLCEQTVTTVYPCCLPQGLRGLTGGQGSRGLPGAQVPTLTTSHSLIPPSLFHLSVKSVIHIYNTIIMVMGIAVIILLCKFVVQLLYNICSHCRNKWNKLLLILIVPGKLCFYGHVTFPIPNQGTKGDSGIPGEVGRVGDSVRYLFLYSCISDVYTFFKWHLCPAT